MAELPVDGCKGGTSDLEDVLGSLNLKITTLFSSASHIVEKVLAHLSLVEIFRVRAVCQLWHSVGNRIISKRCIPRFLTFYHGFKNHNQQTDGFLHKNLTPIETYMQFRECLSSRPDVCIVFCTIDKSHATMPADFVKQLSSRLPISSTVQCVVGRGLIGSNHQSIPHIPDDELTDCASPLRFSGIKRRADGEPISNEDSVSSSLENDIRNVEQKISLTDFCCSWIAMPRKNFTNFRFSMLCLPNTIPKVKFIPFQCNNDTSYTNHSIAGATDFLSSCAGVNDDDQLKALLLFEHSFTDTRTPVVSHFIRAAVKRTAGRVAVGGAVADDCYEMEESASATPGQRGALRTCLGLAVCGEGVTAASVVLHGHVRTRADVIAQLEKLRGVYDPRHRSLAFMIACVGRNSRWYRSADRSKGEQNVELGVFRKMYPNTPVFGTFGHGEYVHEYVPYEQGSKEHVEQEAKLEAHLSIPYLNRLPYQVTYSTVFVLLQFKSC